MSKMEINKKFNLGQLSAELNYADLMSQGSNEPDTFIISSESVEQKILEEAVNAHLCNDLWIDERFESEPDIKTKKAALLAKLGITADEVKILLS